MDILTVLRVQRISDFEHERGKEAGPHGIAYKRSPYETFEWLTQIDAEYYRTKLEFHALIREMLDVANPENRPGATELWQRVKDCANERGIERIGIDCMR